jgi:hypothetical protein
MFCDRNEKRTRMGRFWARCMLGFDPKPRSITVVANLGFWVLLSNEQSFGPSAYAQSTHATG